MEMLQNDILIPFELHTKERCDDCRHSIRKGAVQAGALVQKGNRDFISLNAESTFCFETLNESRDMALETNTIVDFSFYASSSKLMLREWIILSEDLLDMAADPSLGLPKDDLQKALAKVQEELSSIANHFIAAHEKLFLMGAPAPTEKILRDYAEGHHIDDCE